MVPLAGISVVGMNARVTDTGALPTTRSEEAIENETKEMRETMPPDDTELDMEHVPILNLTSTEPAVGAPIVKPLMVTVNSDAGMIEPDVVSVTAVAEVALQDAEKPATLLAPEAIAGTTEDAKKLKG
jgi:hypothetical protein